MPFGKPPREALKQYSPPILVHKAYTPKALKPTFTKALHNTLTTHSENAVRPKACVKARRLWVLESSASKPRTPCLVQPVFVRTSGPIAFASTYSTYILLSCSLWEGFSCFFLGVLRPRAWGATSPPASSAQVGDVH